MNIEKVIYEPGKTNLQTTVYKDAEGVERCAYSGSLNGLPELPGRFFFNGGLPMITAKMKRILDALIKETGFEERKLEQLQGELEQALATVRNLRFQARQEAFKASRSFPGARP